MSSFESSYDACDLILYFLDGPLSAPLLFSVGFLSVSLLSSFCATGEFWPLADTCLLEVSLLDLASPIKIGCFLAPFESSSSSAACSSFFYFFVASWPGYLSSLRLEGLLERLRSFCSFFLSAKLLTLFI